MFTQWTVDVHRTGFIPTGPIALLELHLVTWQRIRTVQLSGVFKGRPLRLDPFGHRRKIWLYN